MSKPHADFIVIHLNLKATSTHSFLCTFVTIKTKMKWTSESITINVKSSYMFTAIVKTARFLPFRWAFRKISKKEQHSTKINTHRDNLLNYMHHSVFTLQENLQLQLQLQHRNLNKNAQLINRYVMLFLSEERMKNQRVFFVYLLYILSFAFFKIVYFMIFIALLENQLTFLIYVVIIDNRQLWLS